MVLYVLSRFLMNAFPSSGLQPNELGKDFER